MPRSKNWRQNDWSLPSALQATGAIIGQYADVISRWSSITINYVNGMTWDSNQDKVDFVENLLRETEKQVFVTWRMKHEDTYKNLVAIAGDTRNITATIRNIFIAEDPAQGSTMEQDGAYADLERLQCSNMQNIFDFLNQYLKLAAKSGRMWLTEELTAKLFRKLPQVIGPAIQKSFEEKYPGLTIGVPIATKYIYDYLLEVCKQAAIQRSMKDLKFCSQMTIPGHYKKSDKRYGLRKAKNYTGKPHKTHVRAFRTKDAVKQKRCSCYICGDPGHFARDCPRQRGNIERVHFLDNLQLPEDWDIMSVELNEEDSDGICSISEGEAGLTISSFVFENPMPYELGETFLVLVRGVIPNQAEGSWMVLHPIPQEQQECEHDWLEAQEIPMGEIQCSYCRNETRITGRISCPRCKLLSCLLCAKIRLGISVEVEEQIQWSYKNKDQLIIALYDHNQFLIKENQLLVKQLELAQRRIADNARLTGADLQAFMEDFRHLSTEVSQKLMHGDDTEERTLVLPLEDEEKGDTIASSVNGEKKAINKLFFVQVEFEITDAQGKLVKFSAKAVIDTGATVCCINEQVVPKSALMDAGMEATFYGVNSTTISKQRLRTGKMFLGNNWFYIPYVYSLPLIVKGIDMLIGCNFIRSMGGGIRFEGQNVIF
uniref:CCHC-type domain-containing protein n=1 Tax=Alhagi bacilliform virus TaxID=1973099 RepID=A0A2D0WL93_9VIRU|nr:hypothetical protein [Alhagi bacilliform virus]